MRVNVGGCLRAQEGDARRCLIRLCRAILTNNSSLETEEKSHEGDNLLWHDRWRPYPAPNNEAIDRGRRLGARHLGA